MAVALFAHSSMKYCGGTAMRRFQRMDGFVWDPSEPVATRPLAMRAKNWGLNLFYSHAGNKNVSEVFHHAPQNGIAAHYDYALDEDFSAIRMLFLEEK